MQWLGLAYGVVPYAQLAPEIGFLAIFFVQKWRFHINDAGLTADFKRKRSIVMEYHPRINILQKHTGRAHQL